MKDRLVPKGLNVGPTLRIAGYGMPVLPYSSMGVIRAYGRRRSVVICARGGVMRPFNIKAMPLIVMSASIVRAWFQTSAPPYAAKARWAVALRTVSVLLMIIGG